MPPDPPLPPTPDPYQQPCVDIPGTPVAVAINPISGKSYAVSSGASGQISVITNSNSTFTTLNPPGAGTHWGQMACGWSHGVEVKGNEAVRLRLRRIGDQLIVAPIRTLGLESREEPILRKGRFQLGQGLGFQVAFPEVRQPGQVVEAVESEVEEELLGGGVGHGTPHHQLSSSGFNELPFQKAFHLIGRAGNTTYFINFRDSYRLPIGHNAERLNLGRRQASTAPRGHQPFVPWRSPVIPGARV